MAWIGILTAVSFLNYFSSIAKSSFFRCILFSGFQTWAQIASAYIKAQQRMEIIAFGNSLGLAIFSALGIFLVVQGLRTLTFLITVQGIFNFVFFWGVALRLGITFPKLTWNSDKAMMFIKEVTPVSLLAGSGIALSYLDIIMISKIKGMSDTATYGLAVKLIENLSILSNSILVALLPFFSLKWDKANPLVLKTIKYTFKFFLIIGLVTVSVFSFFSEQIIMLFYGHQFPESSHALVILIWSFFFYTLGGPLSLIILIEKERILRFVPYAFGVVVLNLILNLFLIPRYSYIGASYSTLICSILLCFFKARFTKDFIPLGEIFTKIAGRPLLATIAMVIVFFFFRKYTLILSLLIGGSSFLLILFILGEFKGEEYGFLRPKQLLQRED